MSEGREPARISAEDVREATFPRARRGYDRDAVHSFLERVADWVESQARGTGGEPGAASSLAAVGQRAGSILEAAERVAADLQAEAETYAQRLRQSAEEQARKTKDEASGKADETVAEAELSVERMLRDAEARRDLINRVASNMVERRSAIAAEAQRLDDELRETVDAMESLESTEEGDETESEQTAAPDRTLFDDDSPGSSAERDRLARAGFASTSRSSGPGRDFASLRGPDDGSGSSPAS